MRVAPALGAVFVLLHAAGRGDWGSGIVRPLVVWLLEAAGFAAANNVDGLQVGTLQVPWSPDCAGLNILATLWALTLWSRRNEPWSAQLWLRLALAVPVSLAANVARILTLIACRHVLFPAVESPQLHNFVGFVWLLPVLGWFMPADGRPRALRLFEAAYLSAVLSLLAPLVGGPGGSVVALATLLLMLQMRLRWEVAADGQAGVLAWAGAGVAIGFSAMESLWLPWLLSAPFFASARNLRVWDGWMLLAGTIPLLAMQPAGSALVVLASLCRAWRIRHGDATEFGAALAPAHDGPGIPARGLAAAGALLILPFAGSAIALLPGERISPPAVAMSRALGGNSYALRLPGQAPDLDVIWHGPQGGGRHHALNVCLRFRGIETRAVAGHPELLTDGRRWLREYFLHRENWLGSYGEYLAATLPPWSPAGAHVIVTSPVESMSAAAFSMGSDRLIARLGCTPEHFGTQVALGDFSRQRIATETSR